MTPDNHISELADRVERASAEEQPRLFLQIAETLSLLKLWEYDAQVEFLHFVNERAFLDAAMSLANGERWSITADGGGTAWQAAMWPDPTTGGGFDWRTASTPALALCSAALRALATGGSND